MNSFIPIHTILLSTDKIHFCLVGGSVVECLTPDCGFAPHQRHCVVSLSKNINPSLVLVQPRKTCPFITERLLMRRKESNQKQKQNYISYDDTLLTSDMYQTIETFRP